MDQSSSLSPLNNHDILFCSQKCKHFYSCCKNKFIFFPIIFSQIYKYEQEVYFYILTIPSFSVKIYNIIIKNHKDIVLIKIKQ